MKRREVGRGGLRSKVVETAETDSDQVELIERLKGCNLLGRIEIAESLARRTLEAHGLPGHWGPFLKYYSGRVEDVSDRYFDVVEDLDRVQNLVGDEPVGEEGRLMVSITGIVPPAPSIENDAAMVLGFARGVRGALAGGAEPAELARRAMRLGEHFMMLQIAIAGWPKLADAGSRARKGARAGGRTRKLTPEHSAAMEDALDRAHKKVIAGQPIGKRLIAEHVARKHHIKTETVRSWLKSVPDPHRRRKSPT